MGEKKGQKGLWIPEEILSDKGLTLYEKCLLSLIAGLDNGEGCYASNEYLAEKIGCHVLNVSRAVSKFTKLGMVKRVSFNGRRRSLTVTAGSFKEQTKPDVNTDLTESMRQTKPDVNADLTESIRQTKPDVNTDLTESITPYINKKDNNKANKKAECSRFAPPTLEEVRAYCRERGNRVDAQRFIDYYTSNGWKVGRNPMKDWKAAVRTWERNDGGAQSTSQSTGGVVYRDIYEIAREKFGKAEKYSQNPLDIFVTM